GRAEEPLPSCVELQLQDGMKWYAGDRASDPGGDRNQVAGDRRVNLTDAKVTSSRRGGGPGHEHGRRGDLLDGRDRARLVVLAFARRARVRAAAVPVVARRAVGDRDVNAADGRVAGIGRARIAVVAAARERRVEARAGAGRAGVVGARVAVVAGVAVRARPGAVAHVAGADVAVADARRARRLEETGRRAASRAGATIVAALAGIEDAVAAKGTTCSRGVLEQRDQRTERRDD